MKILHLSSAKSWRGGEQQVAYLAEELASLQIDQLVFSPEGSPMESWCLENNIPVKTYQKSFSLNPLVALKLKRLCVESGIDLIHTHDNHAHSFAWLAALMGNQPNIVVSRRVDFSIRKSRLSLAKYKHPKIAGIICVSDAIREIVLKDLPDPDRVLVVHSGIDPERFTTQGNKQFRNALGMPDNQLLIGNIAAIAPHKDYFTFVKTAEILIQKGLPAKFLIIGGDGGEEALIRAEVVKRKLENHILFLGFRDDVPQILKELDFLLFTSKTEGLGTSLLDALASGLPVVATRAGGIPEIIQHGKTGLTAETGDASALAEYVLTLINDMRLRANLVAGGLELVKSFSKSETAAASLRIYKSIMQQNR